MLTTAMLLLRSSLFLSLHLAGNTGSFPKPLSAEEEQVYLARCAEGDLEARNVLVERNMRLVAHIIKKGYSGRRIFPGQKRPPTGRRISDGCPSAAPPWCCIFLPRGGLKWW